MKNIIYGSKMKKVDSYTMDVIGIPSMVLMERAAFSVFQYMTEELSGDDKVVCVCGTGNNGADGIALARMLHLRGFVADILVVGNENKATQQWREQKNIAINCGVTIDNAYDRFTKDNDLAYDNITESLKSAMKKYDYVIDAVFGIGLTRNVEGFYAKVISAINECSDENPRQKVYAVDVASGLCADSGRIMGVAVKARKTFTFGKMKTGQLLYRGKDLSGEIIVNDIGFPEKAYLNVADPKEMCKIVCREDIKKAIYRRQYSNKGSYGKVLVIGGSDNVYGALYFNAAAACKMGCGLIRIITHRHNRDLIYDKLPEAMITVYDDTDNEENLYCMVNEAMKWADVVVAGSGIGKGANAKILLENAMKISKDLSKPIVIDADGLNIIAENPQLKKYYHKKTVITPHMGEASRLFAEKTGEIAKNILEIPVKYANENGINVIQKDSTTVILGIESSKDKCNNRICINTTGNAGMATGGSGDVLSGIVAAVLAGGIDVTNMKEYKDASACMSEEELENERIFLCNSLAVYIHGMAGDMAAEKAGKTSLTASDIANMIPEVLKIHESRGNINGEY